MEDRELLELAAKAAGIEVTAIVAGGIPHRFGGGYWNPLTDDGDALRLAVKLQIQVTPGTYNKDEFTAYSPMHVEASERWAGRLQDEFAATRRAIVQVAAKIGKAMP